MQKQSTQNTNTHVKNQQKYKTNIKTFKKNTKEH